MSEPFTGLAPGADHEHERLELHDVVALATDLRRRFVSGNLAATARAQVGCLYDRLRPRHDGESACALARLYITRRFGQLDAAQREFVARSAGDVQMADDTVCLTLLGTRGLESDWNDVRASRGHQVLPLTSPEAVARMPMVARLLSQLGFDIEAVLTAAPAARELFDPRREDGDVQVFYVDDAVGSPHIPAQRDFVERYGVASVVGFGGHLVDGMVFAVILFSRRPIDRALAERLALLEPSVRLALLSALDDDASPRSAAVQARLETMELLVATQARLAADESRRLLAEHEAQNTELRRAHRAMLNVIEDLREARESLRAQVAAQTTELRETNAELLERNRELEQFVYIASHDLQEPLRTVAGYLQLTTRRHGDALPAEATEFMQFAVEGVERMHALIESLLEYSRVSSRGRSFECMRLDDALDDALDNLRLAIEEHQVRLERQPLGEVIADRVQIAQLLQNLIANAIKFAGERTPHIEIGPSTPEPGPSTPEPGGDDSLPRVGFYVRDHGEGFDPRWREAIFAVFRRLQRKQPGTGIGLAICKKIVERHGGTIEADAQRGHGATFTVHLPSTTRSEPEERP